VDEITKLLDEEITPSLEKLRKERSAYLQWAENNTAIERLIRYCVAGTFLQATQTLQKI